MYRIVQYIHFEDVDSYGIIHHPRVLYFFERARTLYLKERGFDVKELPYGLCLRQINIRYKQPLLMHDEVTIIQNVHHIGAYQFTLKYDIIRQSKNIVHAVIDFVTIDLATKKMILLPDNLKTLLTEDLTKKER